MEAIQVTALEAAITTTAIRCYLRCCVQASTASQVEEAEADQPPPDLSRFRSTLRPANGLSHQCDGHLFLPEGWICSGGKLCKSCEVLHRSSRLRTASRPDIRRLTPMDGKSREVSPAERPEGSVRAWIRTACVKPLLSVPDVSSPRARGGLADTSGCAQPAASRGSPCTKPAASPG